MKKFIPALFILLFYVAFPQPYAGVRQIALSNSEISTPESVLCATLNPASINLLQGINAEVCVNPAPFGLTELRTISTAANIPSSFGSFGIAMQHYGFELYNELQIQAIFGRTILDSISAGISFNLYTLNIRNYGSAWSLLANIGFIFPIEKNITLAFSAHNIAGNRLGKIKEKLPSSFFVGASYNFDNSGRINFAFEKETNFAASFNSGVVIGLTEYFDLMASYKTEPALIAAGLNIKYNNYKTQFAMNKHQILGVTYVFGLSAILSSASSER